MSHAHTSKITDNKSYFFPCLTQTPQITGNKSYFWPNLTQIAANHNQQIILLAISHADTSKSQATTRTFCHVSRRCKSRATNRTSGIVSRRYLPANHRQHIVLLSVSAKSSYSQIQANQREKNITSCHVSCRYQQTTGNRSYFLPFLTQIPANHKQPLVLLVMFHEDTCKPQATNRPSCHVSSRRYQQITGNKSYFLTCLT